MPWVIEDLRSAAALHDLAAVEHDGLVGELTHALAIVITGLCERAPQPYTCGAHPGGAAPDSP
jgi:hypothetical protein